MDVDDTFRLILLVGFVVVFPVALYHRLKARAAGDTLDRRAEGLFILVTLRPIALLRVLGVVAFVIEPSWMDWSAIGLPTYARWIGVPIGVSAAVLLIVVFRTLGPNLTDTVVTRANHTLVTAGPYRWVRHPFYCAAALALAADSLVTANWYLALTGLLTITLLAIRTRTEEEKLIERFGDRYREYMARTGRFIPRLSWSV